MNRDPDLGEQALGKVAEVAITSQLDEVEEISVDIHTDPLKLIQGKVDSVGITGEGMVMKQDLRVAEVEISTGAVTIDPLKAIVGQVELVEPTSAEAQIVLTEADLNRALASDYLRNKMDRIEVKEQGKTHLVQILNAQVHLLEDNKISLDVELQPQDSQDNKRCSAVVKPFLQDEGRRIQVEVLSAEGQGLSLEFITAILNQVVDLLDLRNFELDGIALQLEQLSVQPGKMLLQARTLVEKLPVE